MSGAVKGGPGHSKRGMLPRNVVDYLNGLLGADPEAITALFLTRVNCNARLSDHPTCQVTSDFTVGPLGVLNGIFGVDENGWGLIAAEVDGGSIRRFVLREDEVDR